MGIQGHIQNPKKQGPIKTAPALKITLKMFSLHLDFLQLELDILKEMYSDLPPYIEGGEKGKESLYFDFFRESKRQNLT